MSEIVLFSEEATLPYHALAQGDACDTQIRDSDTGDAKRLFLELVMRDVADACDLLRPVWQQTGDGYVSIEVDPNLAHDTEATIEEAAAPSRRLRSGVRPRVGKQRRSVKPWIAPISPPASIVGSLMPSGSRAPSSAARR